MAHRKEERDLQNVLGNTGFVFEVLKALTHAILKKNGNSTHLRRLLKEPELADKIAELLVRPFFPVWKTIKLGTGLKTADDFRSALKRGDFRIGDWGANDLLGRPAFKTSKFEMEVDLVVVSVTELSFPNGATRKDIYKRAKELGLELCPAEVGPQLRLQYGDQPAGEWLLIGMEPLSDSDGYLKVFYVARYDDGAWLDSRYGFPDGIWDGSFRWVFVRGKPACATADR